MLMKSVYEGTMFKVGDPHQFMLTTTASKSNLAGLTGGFGGVSPPQKKKKKKPHGVGLRSRSPIIGDNLITELSAKEENETAIQDNKATETEHQTLKQKRLPPVTL